MDDLTYIGNDTANHIELSNSHRHHRGTTVTVAAAITTIAIVAVNRSRENIREVSLLKNLTKRQVLFSLSPNLNSKIANINLPRRIIKDLNMHPMMYPSPTHLQIRAKSIVLEWGIRPVSVVQNQLWKKIKRRSEFSYGYNDEYYDYICPEETAVSNYECLLDAANNWNKEKLNHYYPSDFVFYCHPTMVYDIIL